MKKICKQTLAILLAVLMLCDGMTTVLAAPVSGTTQNTEVSYGSQNALGQIVQNLSDGDDSEEGYSISYLTVQDGKVKVYVENATACTLVVAAYDESTAQMLSVGVVEIEANTGVAEVTMDGALPEYYVTKAFLIDNESRAALCKNYESREQTYAFQAFLSKHPKDFKDETVLLFDSQKEIEDFAVLKDDVQLGKFVSSMTYTYNEAANAYTFHKATQDIKNLKKGDLFYYPDPNGEYLLFKVKDISATGSTVTITQDADVGMDELFTFIRIDTEGDYDRVEPLQQEDLPDGLTLRNDNKTKARSSGDIGGEFTGELKLNFGLEQQTTETTPQGSVRAYGSVSLSIQVYVHLFYDIELFGDKYFNFLSKISNTVTASVTINGGIDLTPNLTLHKALRIPVGTTGIIVEEEPMIVLRVAASISGVIRFSSFNVLTADSDMGLRVGRSNDHLIDISEIDHKEKLELVVGIRMETKICYITDNLNLTGGLEAGVQFIGTIDDTGVVQDEDAGKMLHECDFCIDGEVFLFGKADLAFEFKLIKNKWRWPFLEFVQEIKLFDFYYSDKLGFGKGECPNRLYAIQVNVWEGAQKKPGAKVVCASAYCDANSDGKYIETEMVTDAEGTALFFGKPGTHTVTMAADGYEAQEQAVDIIDKEKYIAFLLQFFTLNVLVKGEKGQPLSGATVSCEDGRCDADGDGVYSESSILTDNSGKAEFRVLQDVKTHVISVFKMGYKAQTDTVSVVKDKQEKTFTLKKTDSNLIEFGSYPQTNVTNRILINSLNKLPARWISYGYYTGTGEKDGLMQPSDYMRYKDVTYRGNKYRAVVFDCYRWGTYRTPNHETYSYLGKGYESGKVYWFKYEPIRWRILDSLSGLIMCDSIIDIQPFNNYVCEEFYHDSNYPTGVYIRRYWGNEQKTFDASNYAYSSIRHWLNHDFFNTAFTTEQQGLIFTSTLNNYSYCTLSGTESQFCDLNLNAPVTQDKIFLLSWAEATNSEYGFLSEKEPDEARKLKRSDYALCQDDQRHDNVTFPERSWRLRTASDVSGCAVSIWIDGAIMHEELHPHDGSLIDRISRSFVAELGGICPALRVNLGIAAAQPRAKVAAKTAEQNTDIFTVQQGQTYTAATNDTFADREYVLLVRRTGTTNLTAENLLYIDQQTASGSEVSFTCNPRISGDVIVEIVGDFGNGVETKTICGSAAYPSITAVSLDNLAVQAKEKVHLEPIIQGDKVDYTLAYSSSNPKITFIDADGNLTANKGGKSTITVTAKDEYGHTVTDTCVVTVKYAWWQWLIIIFLFGWLWY